MPPLEKRYADGITKFELTPVHDLLERDANRCALLAASLHHAVKIDRSFVRDLPHNEQDKAITKAIISMAHSLHMQVVAEGIETRDQEALLAASDCDSGQGYLYSRPVSAAEIGALVDSFDRKVELIGGIGQSAAIEPV